MAHFAKIKFEGDGKEYVILDVDYDLNKTVGSNGQVTGYPQCGTIRMTLIAPENEDMFLYLWMKSTTEHKDGEIEFRVVQEGKTLIKMLKFESAQCIYLRENFNFSSESQLTISVSFIAKKVTFSGGGENSNEEVYFECF
jgi:hypothetical protein